MPASALSSLLARLEAEIHHPGRICTRERLDALLHPDFHEIGRSGVPYTREQVIGFLAGRTAIPEVRAMHHRVEPLSDSLALLSFDTDEPGPDGSRVRAARRSSIWQKSDAGWQLRYHHATPFDPATGGS